MTVEAIPFARELRGGHRTGAGGSAWARLPNALPQMFSGIKIAAPLSVVSADAGLGYLIIRANNPLATEIVFGSIILLSLAGIALFLAVALIERLALPWRRAMT